MKGDDLSLDSDVSAELKELRKVKRDYERLKIEHNLLKKQSSSLLLEIRHLRLHRLSPKNARDECHV